MKDPRRTTKPTPPEREQPQAARQPGAPEGAESEEKDPKAISESLRRIRTSGPLIIEAIKQKQERINEIIAQSVEGLSKGLGEPKREEPKPPKPPAPPPPPVQPNRQRPAREKTNAQSAPPPAKPTAPPPAKPTAPPPARPAAPPPARPAAPPTGSRSSDQSGLQATAQTIAQTAANTLAKSGAAPPPAPRKTAGALPDRVAPRSNTNIANSMSAVGQLPLNGPSTVLAQASGLNPRPSFGSKFRVGLIALAVLLAAGLYFMFRDRLLNQPYIADSGRNLVSPDDQSAQLTKLAERDREQGNYEPAIGNFQRALELAPNNTDIRFMLAQTYLSAGQTDEALRTYRELLRIAPEHLETRLQIAGIYRARGDWNAAFKEYQNVIELDQNSPQATVALEAIEKYQAEQAELLARRNRAGQRTAPALPAAVLGQTQVALPLPRVAAAAGLKPPAALNNRPEERPDPRALADTHKKLGVRYLNIRQYRAAIYEFLQALSLTPDDKDLYYFLGSSYHGLGQMVDAYNYYRRVDSGQYLGPAQSGAKQTEKAARDAYRRGEAQRFGSMKNEARIESEVARPDKPLAPSFKE
jgi:tetratricopeptide (TPR) repeat protein